MRVTVDDLFAEIALLSVEKRRLERELIEVTQQRDDLADRLSASTPETPAEENK